METLLIVVAVIMYLMASATATSIILWRGCDDSPVEQLSGIVIGFFWWYILLTIAMHQIVKRTGGYEGFG